MIQPKPSALSRLKMAFQFYRNGYRRFQWQPQQTKKVPFMWPAWINNQPQWQLVNYEAYAQEGFNANAVIYSAIMYKVRSITIAPLRAYTGTKEEPELLPPEHPLQALCLRPNRFQSWSEFQALATVYFNLSGNCYIVLERDGENISAMYLLRPDRVFIVPSANREQLIGFWYVPEGKAWQDGKPYLPQDTIHIKLPNPLDPLDGLGYGVSPLSPAAQSGEVDNDLTKFLRLFFKSGAMPPGVLSFDVPMMDEDVSRARERWMEVYGGYENWTDVAVLDQGGKYERVGFTFQEMDVSKLDARNESRIVAPFGVPLNLIESRPELVQSTYSNKQQDRAMFWQDTMIPELKWFETDYQYYLQGQASEFVMFDTSDVPALTMTQAERLDRFQKAFETGAVTVDEHRAELGLDPLPEMEQQPAPTSQNTEEEAPEAEEQAEEAGDKAKKKDIDRTTFWRKADRLAIDYEAEFGEAAIAAFEGDLRHIEAIINDTNRDALESRASLNWGTVVEAVGLYLTTNAGANWQRHFMLPFHMLMTDRINDLNELLNKSKQRRITSAELLGQEWFDEYTIQFAQPINATTEEQVRRVIEQGVRQGWSVPTVMGNLETLFRQWMTGSLTPEEFEWFDERMPAFRREVIARTETIKAMNLVSLRLFGVSGITEKEWLSAQDNRVRSPDSRRSPSEFDHEAADGEVVAIDRPFIRTGEPLMFPGDPQGSIGNIAMCRCTILPVL